MQNIDTQFSAGDEPKEESFFSKLAFTYLPHWPLFLLIFVISLGAAWIYLRYATPIYKATAYILIKDEDRGVYESPLTEALNPFGSSKIVENEMVILQSQSLLKEVAKNLKLYTPIFQEGRVKTTFAYNNSPVQIELANPVNVKPRSNITFFYNDTTGYVSLLNLSVPLFRWFKIGDDSIRFVPNREFNNIKPQHPYFFSILPLNEAASSISIKATPTNKLSTVITLSAEDPVPERAADILNELMRVYNLASIRDKNALAENTLTFVEDRLRFVVNELDSVEGALQKYRTSENVVNLSTQSELFLSNVGDLDKQLSEINIQLSVLEEVERYVQSSEKKSAIVPSTLGVNDPVLTNLLQELYEKEIQFERGKKAMAENHPVMLALREEMSKIKPSILDNIRSQRINLLASKANLNKTSSSYSSILKTLPQKERGLLNISRQQAIKNNIYTFLLQKREETALQFGSTVPDSRIVDPSDIPTSPIKPRGKLIYAIAFIIGILIFVTLVSVKEMFNDKILFRKDIERYLSWPIVGELMYNTSHKNIVTGTGKRTAIAEQFAIIRSSLDYIGVNSSQKKILITSSISGDGKSFVALNLATSLALTDKKVALIELDLRKPKLSSMLNKKNKVGISNYLIGKYNVWEIIQPSDVNQNLFFISSGPLPPNPSELLLKGKLEELFSELEKSFDYIVVDSAPIVPVTDASIISKYCDVTIYVIRHGTTPKTHIRHLEQNSKARGLRNVCIVFNGLKSRGIGKYGDNYGYGYGYGGGYGYGETEESVKRRGIFKRKNASHTK